MLSQMVGTMRRFLCPLLLNTSAHFHWAPSKYTKTLKSDRVHFNSHSAIPALVASTAFFENHMLRQHDGLDVPRDWFVDFADGPVSQH